TGLAAARPRREARSVYRRVPAAEHAADGLAGGVVLARLVPLAGQRGPAVLAIPERDRVDDRLRRPAEPPSGAGSPGAPPSWMGLDGDTEGLQDQVGVRLDQHRVEPVGNERWRLEAVAGDEQDDAVVL